MLEVLLVQLSQVRVDARRAAKLGIQVVEDHVLLGARVLAVQANE